MSRTIQMTLTRPQADFFQLQDKYPAFVGGFGTGKTETMATCALRDGLESSSALIALYEPTYDLVRLILAPRMQDKLSEVGIRYKYNKQENIIYTSSGQCGDFVMRTLENPARIVGYESYRAHIDEIDTLKADQAESAWNKIIARNRQRPNGIESPFNRVSVYSTPEGYRFLYDRWVRNPRDGYKLIQASTLSNPFLPSDYVESLRQSYPPQLIEAYINGQFVNMASGSVYPDFDRQLNRTGESIRPGEVLHVGMDFNVNRMSAAISVIRDDLPLTLAEITDGRDTPAVCQILKDRYRGHQVIVYPDSSGNNASSRGAGESDFTILRQNGFTVRAHPAHPAVRDRVNAMNAMILNAKGERRLLINTDTCPKLTEALEQQAYDKNGAPDKKTGHDHIMDAIGYFIEYRYPVTKRIATVQPLRI